MSAVRFQNPGIKCRAARIPIRESAFGAGYFPAAEKDRRSFPEEPSAGFVQAAGALESAGRFGTALFSRVLGKEE